MPDDLHTHIWNLSRANQLMLIRNNTLLLDAVRENDEQLDKVLEDLGYLVHVVRERIFYDIRERNRVIPFPRKPHLEDIA